MWVSQSRWDSLQREIGTLTGQVALLEHHLAASEDERRALHADLKAERKENNKHQLALADRMVQSRGGRPISEPPKREASQHKPPELTPTQKADREMYGDAAEGEGKTRQEGYNLWDAHHRGEVTLLPFEETAARTIG